MTYLVAGLLLFFGVHSIAIVAPAWRDGMAAKLGDAPWKAIYSLVSVIGFVMLVHGYGLARAEPTVLYTPPVVDAPRWPRCSCCRCFRCCCATYLPGRIKAAVKHPMLTATKAWALAHLLVNGNLADVLLFGGFLAWAVADRIAVGKRAVQRKPMVTGAPSRMNDVLAVVGGLALYVVFVAWAHQRFIGVPPMLPH